MKQAVLFCDGNEICLTNYEENNANCLYREGFIDKPCCKLSVFVQLIRLIYYLISYLKTKLTHFKLLYNLIISYEIYNSLHNQHTCIPLVGETQ